jgi:hypothetical protein
VRSVDYIVSEALRLESETAGLGDAAAVGERRKRIAEIERRGIVATPANSRHNELVCQAARLSILNGGREVEIRQQPPGVEFRAVG